MLRRYLDSWRGLGDVAVGGLRWSKQISLEWRDVDFLTGYITETQGLERSAAPGGACGQDSRPAVEPHKPGLPRARGGVDR
jgi:hypothetical protein